MMRHEADECFPLDWRDARHFPTHSPQLRQQWQE